jgi:hypothetical protein
MAAADFLSKKTAQRYFGFTACHRIEILNNVGLNSVALKLLHHHRVQGAASRSSKLDLPDPSVSNYLEAERTAYLTVPLLEQAARNTRLENGIGTS